MSFRSDALAAMRGDEPEMIPFIGRMNLWYNYHRAAGTLPQEYEGWAYWDVVRDLGIGILGFGAWIETFFKRIHRKVEKREYTREGETVTEYVTPYGTLCRRHLVTDLLRGTVDTGTDTEVLFKDEGDYDALQYLIEHTEIVENYAPYAEYAERIGEDGIALPFTGWAPMHEIMWRYMGVERFYYELHDHPQRLEQLHEALLHQHRQIIELAVEGPADAIEVGGNYDDQITPPSFWDAYVAPYYAQVAEQFERHGKILVVHGDGDMNKLLPRIRDAGIQVVEALTPRPSTTIDLRRLRETWQDEVTIWGGIPFIILTPVYSEGDFRAYIEDLYRAVAPGDRFVLGFGDNVPPEADLDRIRWLVAYNEAHGRYPITKP